MVFCGQCGYQLSPGDQVCPRCGAKTEVDALGSDPNGYNPTEMSQAILNSPAQSPYNYNTQLRQPEAQGPLVLGPATPGEQMPDANAATTMMSAQGQGYPPQQFTGIGATNQPTYMPTNQQTYIPQQSYPGYPVPGTGAYPYPDPTYQQFRAGQSAAATQLLAASRRGKTASLLLILFGILLLVGAIVIFLLTQQGVIFHT